MFKLVRSSTIGSNNKGAELTNSPSCPCYATHQQITLVGPPLDYRSPRPGFFYKKINTCKVFDTMYFDKKSWPCHIRVQSTATKKLPSIQVCKPIDRACAATQGVVPRCAVGPTQSMDA
jgi:hypothetical protein